MSSSKSSTVPTNSQPSQAPVASVQGSSVVSAVASVAPISKVETSPKVEFSNPVNVPKCDLPKSKYLQETSLGCFEILFSIGDSEIFKSTELPDSVNYNLLYKTEDNVNMLQNLAIDYYGKLPSSERPKIKQVWFSSSKKTSSNTFEITVVSLPASSEYKLNLIFDATYTLTLNSNNQWVSEFKKFNQK